MLRALLVFYLVIANAIDLAYFESPAGKNETYAARRRQDLARIASAFTDYQSNNAGKMPQTEQEVELLISKYINGGGESCGDTGSYGQFCDPDGTPYQMHAPTVVTEDIPYPLGTNPTVVGNNHEIHYYVNAVCGDGGSLPSITKRDGLRNIALLYVVKDGIVHCVDNW